MKKGIRKRLPFSFVFQVETKYVETERIVDGKRCRSSLKLPTDSFQFPQVSLVNCTPVLNVLTKCAKQKPQKQSMRDSTESKYKWIRTCIWPKGIQRCSIRRGKTLNKYSHKVTLKLARLKCTISTLYSSVYEFFLLFFYTLPRVNDCHSNARWWSMLTRAR